MDSGGGATAFLILSTRSMPFLPRKGAESTSTSENVRQEQQASAESETDVFGALDAPESNAAAIESGRAICHSQRPSQYKRICALFLASFAEAIPEGAQNLLPPTIAPCFPEMTHAGSDSIDQTHLAKAPNEEKYRLFLQFVSSGAAMRTASLAIVDKWNTSASSGYSRCTA